jgi:hypothetical protein
VCFGVPLYGPRRPRPPRAAGVAGTLVRVTPKLAPSLPIAEGIASGCPFASTSVIGVAAASPRLTSLPLSVADPPLNETELKLSSGRMPPGPDGASSIHSADDSVDV